MKDLQLKKVNNQIEKFIRYAIYWFMMAKGRISELKIESIDASQSVQNIKEKQTAWRSVGQYQVYHHEYWGFQMQREKGIEKAFEEIMVDSIPDLIKRINL